MSDQGEAEVPPLRNRTLDGAFYTRPQDIEALLAGLVCMPEEEVLARAAIRRRFAPGWLPGECLVHMMRRSGRRKDQRSYNKWCRLLLDRIRAQLLQWRTEETAQACEIAVADYGLDRFVRLLGPDLADYNMSLDIYEARFDLALANLRRDGFEKTKPAGEQPVEVELGDNPKLQAEVELVKADFDLFGYVRENDDDFRSRAWAAIDALPPEQNRILTMMRDGIAVADMATTMKVTTRTILNWKKTAFEAVRKAALGEDQ